MTSHKSTTKKTVRKSGWVQETRGVGDSALQNLREEKMSHGKFRGKVALKKRLLHHTPWLDPVFEVAFGEKTPKKNKDLFGLETRAKKQMKPGLFFIFVFPPPPRRKKMMIFFFFFGAAFGSIWFHPLE